MHWGGIKDPIFVSTPYDWEDRRTTESCDLTSHSSETESKPAARRSRSAAVFLWVKRRECPRPGGVLCSLTSGADRGRGAAAAGVQPHEGLPAAAFPRVGACSEAWRSDGPHDL